MAPRKRLRKTKAVNDSNSGYVLEIKPDSDASDSDVNVNERNDQAAVKDSGCSKKNPERPKRDQDSPGSSNIVIRNFFHDFLHFQRESKTLTGPEISHSDVPPAETSVEQQNCEGEGLIKIKQEHDDTYDFDVNTSIAHDHTYCALRPETDQESAGSSNIVIDKVFHDKFHFERDSKEHIGLESSQADVLSGTETSLEQADIKVEITPDSDTPEIKQECDTSDSSTNANGTIAQVAFQTDSGGPENDLKSPKKEEERSEKDEECSESSNRVIGKIMPYEGDSRMDKANGKVARPIEIKPVHDTAEIELAGDTPVLSLSAKRTCTICGKILCSKSSLARHVKQHKSKRTFPCSFCKKRFVMKKSLESHLLKYHPRKIEGRKFCRKMTYVKDEKLMEIKSVWGTDVPPNAGRAKKCPEESDIKKESKQVSKQDIKTKESKQDSKQESKQDIKTKESKQDSKQDIKTKSMTFNERRTCSICGKVLFNKSSLTRHMRQHSEEKPYECSICEKAFAVQRQLKEHEKIHSDERPYECSVCGKKFRKKAHLKGHLITHTGEKPYRCSICGTLFSQKSALNMHLKSHSGQKPHVCAVCGNRFVEKRALERHLKTHTGEDPTFECSICGKHFLDKRGLRHHQAVHTGERQCECPTCGKVMKHRGNLDRHMKKHTGDLPFKCSICGKRFVEKAKLERHMVIHAVHIGKYAKVKGDVKDVKDVKVPHLRKKNLTLKRTS